MARGHPLVLHHRRNMCSSFYLYLGFKIRSPSSPNLEWRCSVYILCLVRGLFYPRNFALRVETTSFHPQSNGMIERFHRSLKSSLRARLASSDWVAHLLLVMLGLRSLPKEDSGFSPAEAVYGSNLSLPGEFLEHSKIPPESFLRKVELAV